MKAAFVFPGQGSQSVGMMNSYSELPSVRGTFNEASDILQQDLWSLVSNGPEDSLNLTTNTQPVMLAADVSIYRAWQQAGGIEPHYLAGHSLGEYAALVAAEVLTFTDALKLVRYRAKVMQETVPEGTGGMAAIVGLDDDIVSSVCTEVINAMPDTSLEPANFNAPGQVVIAGHSQAVARAVVLAKSKGAKLAVILPMSIPSHCSLMQSAAEKFALLLEEIALQPPRIPILHNADVQQHSETASIREILVRQLYRPVRWTETIQAIAAQNVKYVVECGPGKVLSGLNRRIDKNLENIALTDSGSLLKTVETLK
ncbi:MULTISPECIES: ACP S-malonyltransferase [Nitrosomonas]|uniref:Malonyl CoA-acyl carrier protein transacylase n=1 Tax=Nitrosomonas europaea (strain ATCC 19718 / CIP 103999 / KCTC 2705 / NBRC 14298) TaxID=228410 RepID=Q82U59_NITEU|nr:MULTISPECIES: ACP S-malonyltransferase [Nitrosomonas]MCE7916871.1 [acyl-carrier-protein] S-malonyltransferase [Nitrosomonas sp. PRO5]KXK43816.1 MAG: malonyl CoA-ACP transacylase [Nitrosomonas europaea]MBV6388902.1 Malonyl CoA-acyl carrier protein transacylase [Nitrosomonas europaea]MEB2331249.1 ACP S-malonyltransferase [Nitrosomonas sp.]QOJ08385.1 MAG: ACP S-malonyltransferase [Nitrosomonas sp. H1_AOB3]